MSVSFHFFLLPLFPPLTLPLMLSLSYRLCSSHLAFFKHRQVVFADRVILTGEHKPKLCYYVRVIHL